MKLKLMLAALVLLMFTMMAAGPAFASGTGACSAEKARREMIKARQIYREAVRVYDATRYYSNHNYDDFCGRHIEHPENVGRWVKLARRAGWGWAQMDTLMHVIARESSGSPGVDNSQGSGAAGLLQLMPGWYDGDYYDFPDFDPHNAYLNLYYGHKGWMESGWTPWGL